MVKPMLYALIYEAFTLKNKNAIPNMLGKVWPKFPTEYQRLTQMKTHALRNAIDNVWRKDNRWHEQGEVRWGVVLDRTATNRIFSTAPHRAPTFVLN